MNQLMKRVDSKEVFYIYFKKNHINIRAPLCLRGRGRRVHGRLKGPLGV